MYVVHVPFVLNKLYGVYTMIHVRHTCMTYMFAVACTPHTYVVFSMFETTHMHDDYVYTMIRVGRTPVRRSCTPYMYHSVNTVLSMLKTTCMYGVQCYNVNAPCRMYDVPE